MECDRCKGSAIQKQYDVLWATFILKLARIDELRAKGRYGYQLRMPGKALRLAEVNLRVFCSQNNIESPV